MTVTDPYLKCKIEQLSSTFAEYHTVERFPAVEQKVTKDYEPVLEY